LVVVVAAVAYACGCCSCGDRSSSDHLLALHSQRCSGRCGGCSGSSLRLSPVVANAEQISASDTTVLHSACSTLRPQLLIWSWSA
jgi:hypothetical protein